MKKPFSKKFVMKTTFHHMIRSVEISISKTIERFNEFEEEESREISKEVMETLSLLNKMKSELEGYREANSHLFEDE